MTTILLTGLPRSGTTLLCALLNEQPNTVALAEPIETLGVGGAVATCGTIADFVQAVRARILTEGLAPTNAAGGPATDNFFEAPREDGGLRAPIAQRRDVRVEKPLTPDFRLYIKHPAAFTALAESLSQRWPLYAIVRSPLAVLASWQTLDFNASHGHAPVAERLDTDLACRLAEIPDRLERQVELIAWFLSKYSALAPGQIIKYEELVLNPGAALSSFHPDASPVRYPVRRDEPAQRYPGVELSMLAGRLRRILPVIEQFYPGYRDTLDAMLTG